MSTTAAPAVEAPAGARVLPRGSGRPSLFARVGPFVALLAVAVLTVVVLQVDSRGWTFYFDEWDFVLKRQGMGASQLLEPHLDHLSLVPILGYKVLLHIFGMDDYWGFMLAIALTAIACGLAVFFYARPRIGVWPAVVPAVLVMFMGKGSDDLLWPFQIGFLGCLVFGVVALLALDRGTRRGEILASVMIGLALASSSPGAAILAGVTLEILLSPGWRRRLWIVLAPAALYAVWYFAYHYTNFQAKNLLVTPRYVADAASGAVGGLVGEDVTWGIPLLVALVALLVWRFVGGRAFSPRLVALMAMALTFWGLTGVLRADVGEPTAPRYIFIGGFFVALVLVELASSRGPYVVRPRVGAAVAVIVGLVLLSNVQALRDRSVYLGDFSDWVRPQLTAMELARPVVPPGFRLDANKAPDIYAGLYFSMLDRYGSAADPVDEVAARPPGPRQAADLIFARALTPGLTPVRRPSSFGEVPRPTAVEGVRVRVRGGCAILVPAAGGGAAYFGLPAGGLVLRTEGAGGAGVAMRRFADAYGIELNRLAPGVWGQLKLPGDRAFASHPFQIRVTPTAPTRVCALP